MSNNNELAWLDGVLQEFNTRRASMDSLSMDNRNELARLDDALEAYFEPTNYYNRNGSNIGEDSALAMLKVDLKRLGLMLCGGAITSLFTRAKVNDLDFYMTDITRKQEVDDFLRIFFPEHPYKSDNALTYKRQSSRSRKVWSVQLITRFHGTPQDILDTFDFTVTQGIYSFVSNTFTFGDRFFQDLASKRLTYLGMSRFPICAMYRTKKYQERGYSVPGSTIMHIALSIVRLEIKTYKDLKQQLMGIDTMYLQGLLNKSQYADDIPVDYGQFMADAFSRIDGIEQDPEDYNEAWKESPDVIQ